jgi:undecaprenyl diphosphate synthase
MDGNGRWAKKRLLTRAAGHRAGAENLRKLSERMNEEGFKALTVYAFSTENWRRPPEEVQGLMSLLSEYIRRYIDEADGSDARLTVMGDISRLEKGLRDKIGHLVEKTKSHKGLRLNIAINYGGRDEIVRAARRLAADVSGGKIRAAEIDETVFSSYLDAPGLPDPDMIIRTGGEARLSNFLLWQGSYAEFVISEKLWPDFKYEDLLRAVESFRQRDRRYGRVN